MRALHPPTEPATIVLVICGRVTRADIATLCDRARVWLDDSDAEQVVCDMRGVTDPDAVTVDTLARLQLIARCSGRRIRLRNASHELRDLLVLMGLIDVVPLSET